MFAMVDVRVLFAILILPNTINGILMDGKSREDSLILAIAQSQMDEIIPLEEVRDATPRRKRSSSNLELIQFKVESKIKYRYSQTHVTSHVRNTDSNNGQEVTFQVILPETAFISKFIMEIDHKQYEAYVKKKEEAKEEYDRAKSRGQSAGLLELNARHANVFNVNVNIKAGSIIWFNLTYEELLSRRFGRYEQVITMNGDEISTNNDVQVVIDIEESQPLTMVKALNLRNELEGTEAGASKDAIIENSTPNRAHISWSPRSKADTLKRFIVQYDVKRELDSGQVLIMNGYFVHFFAPPKLKPLQKHVVFVLDVSGSMSGRKIDQLKEAMREILKDLNSNDFLNIIIFSNGVTMWTPGEPYMTRYDFGGRSTNYGIENSPQPFPANSKNLQEAKQYIESLTANGGTNINDALIEALNLTARVRRARDEQAKQSDIKNRFARAALRSLLPPAEVLPPRAESMILFLTDGEPTSGETGLDKIQRNIQLANLGISVPIFSLAFGTGADFTFLRKLSLQNHAFARKIYEAADAALQLQGFYAEISSPLLSNVEFNYTSPESPYEISEVTRRKFPTFFDGWELAVAGKIEPSASTSKVGPIDDEPPKLKIADHSLIRYPPTDHCHFYCSISGTGYDGIHHWHRPLIYVHHHPWWCYPMPPPPPRLTTTTPRPLTDEDTFLERLWAYLTIQNLIEKDIAGVSESGETPKEKALRLALRYGFVTAQTSLVVVKPESKDVANAESVDARRGQAPGGSGGSGGGGSRPSAALRFTKGSHRHTESFGGAGDTLFLEKADERTSTSSADGGSWKKSKVPVTKPPAPPAATKPAVRDKEAHKKPAQYTLKDVTWLTGDKIGISSSDGLKQYRVAKTEKEVSNSSPGMECFLGKKSSKLNQASGQCQHLKDCIKEEFMEDFDAYQDYYFCPIKSTSSSDIYAGACCA